MINPFQPFCVVIYISILLSSVLNYFKFKFFYLKIILIKKEWLFELLYKEYNKSVNKTGIQSILFLPLFIYQVYHLIWSLL